jgi:hypothetical protein
MGEGLTSYDEISGSPWTVTGKPDWRIVNHKGKPLFWELRAQDSKAKEPEDLIVFLRTVFPNGGHFAQSHCNHCFIWSPLQGDSYGIGFRRLKSKAIILATVECTEEYPGASACPDRDLCFQGTKFLAEEFLRGTDPSDIYRCETSIYRRNQRWWQYLEKLERVVHWKYPEVASYKNRKMEVSSVDGICMSESRREANRHKYEQKEYSRPGRRNWEKYDSHKDWRKGWGEMDGREGVGEASSGSSNRTRRKTDDGVRSRSPTSTSPHSRWKVQPDSN